MQLPDYWSFPAVARSFQATGYGTTVTDEHGHVWRKRRGDYVLLSPPRTMPAVPADANLTRIRSLTWTERSFGEGVPRKTAAKTYNALPSWKEPEDSRARYYLRRGGRELTIDDAETDRWELDSLLNCWHEDKQEHKPSAMVIHGHYAAMIKDNGFKFLRYRGTSGVLVAAVGYTEAEGTAAICFAKHVYGTWWLSSYVWLTAIRRLLDGGSIGVVCGDTADRLKESLGLEAERTYRVDFREG